MALLFLDSFDHYQSANFTQKWTAGAGLIDAAAGRCSTQALRVDGARALDRGLSFGSNTVLCGFAFKQDGATSIGATSLVSFTSPEGTHCSISRTFDGSVAFQYSDSGTTITTLSVPNVLHVDTWYYIEWKVLLHATAGTAEVRVNGIAVISYSGKTNSDYATGPGYAQIPLPPRAFHVQGITSALYWLDDLYVQDGAGPAPWNDFLGDVHVEYLRPRAPGSSQSWSVTGAPSHWQAVDDNATPDGDTSYVSSNTPGDRDTNLYMNTGFPGGTPLGAQLSLYASKSDIGPKTIAPVANGVVGTAFAPSQGAYFYQTVPYPTNPATGLAWTLAQINAAEFGVEVVT